MRPRRTAKEVQDAIRDALAKAATERPIGRAEPAMSAFDAWDIVSDGAIADTAAQNHQKRLRHWNRMVYILAVVSVAFGAFEAIVFPVGGPWRWLIVGEIFAFAVLLVALWFDVRHSHYVRWVSTRALAEYLRIESFLFFVNPTQGNPFELDRLSRLVSWSPKVVGTPGSKR